MPVLTRRAKKIDARAALEKEFLRGPGITIESPADFASLRDITDGSQRWIAACGVALSLQSAHEHEHHHDPMQHTHEHDHADGHHDHVHDDGFTGTHSHPHEHGEMVHSHPHVPDLHHRHDH